MSTMLTALCVMGGLVLILTTILWLAHSKWHVDEDERIDLVEQALPNNNCGACGFPGCRQFAEALVTGKAQPGQCTVGTAMEHKAIAEFLGVDLVNLEKQVARVACGGGTNVARVQAHYQGVASCRAAALAGGGGKGCPWGCLGFGDCAEVCEFDAIHMDRHGLPVIAEGPCTACGDCVEACPKDLISLHPESKRLWVNCKNQAEGDGVLEYCEVACNGCGRCVADAGEGQIRLQSFLAVIDYATAEMIDKPMQRCPTGSIVWLNGDGSLRKGKSSNRVIRQSELKSMPT